MKPLAAVAWRPTLAFDSLPGRLLEHTWGTIAPALASFARLMEEEGMGSPDRILTGEIEHLASPR